MDRRGDGAWLAERFPDRLWIEFERHGLPDDLLRLAHLRRLGGQLGLPLVAAGDVHMHVRRRRPLQDVLTAVRLNSTVFAAGPALFPNAERAMRHRLRLATLYPPDLLAQTLVIADRCRFSLDELRYEYPEEIVAPGHTASSYLRQQAAAGLAVRYPNGVPGRMEERVAHELQTIAALRYEGYFLTVYDIVRFARSRGILCQGRGSAANSAVCFALGITEGGPVRADLLFQALCVQRARRATGS